MVRRTLIDDASWPKAQHQELVSSEFACVLDLRRCVRVLAGICLNTVRSFSALHGHTRRYDSDFVSRGWRVRTEGERHAVEALVSRDLDALDHGARCSGSGAVINRVRRPRQLHRDVRHLQTHEIGLSERFALERFDQGIHGLLSLDGGCSRLAPTRGERKPQE